MQTLIKNGTLVTMDPRRSVVRADLLVEDGRITRIGRSMPPSRRPRKVIDATDFVVMPGLIQAHIHLCQTLFRNRADGLQLLDWLRQRIWPFEAAHDEKSMRASADLGIAELLKGGTTALQDMGTVHHYEQAFEAAAASGIRMLGGKAMMDAGEGVPKRLKETTRASVDESLALARAWHGSHGGRLTYAFCPRFVLSCTEELMREVARVRRSIGARIHTHASENPKECQVVR
ncbi:MAG: amidohydrolase family protein, partial [Myxococcales bacterium]